MRLSPLQLCFGIALSLSLVVGCGSETGPAQAPNDIDEVQQFLADNPDQNVDSLDEDLEMEEEEELE